MVAFLAMQIGVYPRTVAALILLSGLVGANPVTLCIPPQASQRDGESGWGGGLGERLSEVVQIHDVILLRTYLSTRFPSDFKFRLRMSRCKYLGCIPSSRAASMGLPSASSSALRTSCFLVWFKVL